MAEGSFVRSGMGMKHGCIIINWIQSVWRHPIHSYDSCSDSSSSSRAGYSRFGAPLARTGIKQFNFAGLLDFPNVIRPNESNPDDETSHFVAVCTLKM